MPGDRAAGTTAGYAIEMTAALTTAAFGVPGIERVEIHHDRANVASWGVPERVVFRFAGESPDEVTASGEEGVDWAWEMPREGWSGSPTLWGHL